MGFNRTAVSSSLTGVSPRPMLMGAPRNAVWAFNAGVSLCVLRCRRPQSRYACFAAWYRSLALNRGHGAPAVWLGAKGTYPICPMLRRRYLAPLSLSRFRMALLPRQQRNGKGGERKRPAAAVYSSALKVRTAIISFACSRSRMSWSTPK